MSAILGMRGSGDFTVTGQRPESWDEKVVEKYGNLATLTAILAMLPRGKDVDDYKYHWFEEALPTQRLRINNGAGYGAAITLLTVDTENTATPVAGAKQVRKGTKLLCERTGEILYVADDPVNDVQIAVTREFGTTAAAALVDNDWLTILSATHAEGADVPTAIGYDTVEVNNCTEIFRVPISLTGSALETNFRDGDAYKNARRRALRDYSIHKEMSYLLGEYKVSTDPDTGQRMSATRGIVPHLSTYASGNVIDVGGALSESAWKDYMRQVFMHGRNKIALCGGTALAALDSMATNGNIKMQDVPTSKTYGMELTAFRTTFGMLTLKQHELFSKHPVLTNNILIVDTDNIEEVVMKNRGTSVKKDRQSPGVDGKIDEFFGESGIKTKYAESHMYLKNITSYVP